GVVVEPLDGVDALPDAVRGFGPGPGRRLGVLVDHLVAGTKESRIVASVTSPDVLVTGHPYVDIWQAVKPARLGIRAWPVVPRGQPWKEGVCAALGVAEPAELWRRILASVRGYKSSSPSWATSNSRPIHHQHPVSGATSAGGGGDGRHGAIRAGSASSTVASSRRPSAPSDPPASV